MPSFLSDAGRRALVGVQQNHDPGHLAIERARLKLDDDVIFPPVTSAAACTRSDETATRGSEGESPAGSMTSACSVVAGRVGEGAAGVELPQPTAMNNRVATLRAIDVRAIWKILLFARREHSDVSPLPNCVRIPAHGVPRAFGTRQALTSRRRPPRDVVIDLPDFVWMQLHRIVRTRRAHAARRTRTPPSAHPRE